MDGFTDVDTTWQWGPLVGLFFISLLFLSFFPSLSSLSVPLLGGHGGSGRSAVPGRARRDGGEPGLARGQGSPAGLACAAAIVNSSLLRALAVAVAAH